jgi:hypothetical protein
MGDDARWACAMLSLDAFFLVFFATRGAIWKLVFFVLDQKKGVLDSYCETSTAKTKQEVDMP